MSTTSLFEAGIRTGKYNIGKDNLIIDELCISKKGFKELDKILLRE
ncbi:hypothetical protein KPL47_04935 [Clostridium estertheticum]|nr:hypothetical protein [Clostridium estertheticum]MBU3175707.1 hypothetical protein [Clostridium estertheticum]